MTGMIVSGAVAVLMCGLLLVTRLIAGKKYDAYIEYVDEKEYGLKDMIPAGLFLYEHSLTDRLPMYLQSALAQHQNVVARQILELRGVDDAEFYRYIHSGYRLMIGMVAAAGISALGFIMAVQGDMTSAYTFAIASIPAAIGIPFLVDMQLSSDIAKRRRSIRIEFPEFVNKLTLLVNAGMTISKAWEKIVKENKKDHVLYREMTYMMGDIQAGKPERVAYEEFARRCSVKEVTKFVSVILMNLRRGGSEVVPVLRQQGNECWEMRKNAAKEIGEEANSKIMLPLIIMFLAIVLISVTPALLEMSQTM